MELTQLELTKNRVKFEMKGEGHTFCNALRKELWNDASVDIAGYFIEHSLVSEPKFTLQVSKGDSKKVLLAAVTRLEKQQKQLHDLFKKI